MKEQDEDTPEVGGTLGELSKEEGVSGLPNGGESPCFLWALGPGEDRGARPWKVDLGGCAGAFLKWASQVVAADQSSVSDCYLI